MDALIKGVWKCLSRGKARFVSRWKPKHLEDTGDKEAVDEIVATAESIGCNDSVRRQTEEQKELRLSQRWSNLASIR